MSEELKNAKSVLVRFQSLARDGIHPAIDRSEVVAHALLSALTHHWPSHSDAETEELLQRTSEIKETERSRWITQRRIGIAKLSKYFS